MKYKKIVYHLFAAIAFGIIVSACQTSSGEMVYGIGDVVDVGFDMTMVLSNVEFRDDVLEASFIVENNGTEDQNFNLALSLQARDSEETPMAQLIPCGSSQQGTLHPGEQVTGSICWTTDSTEVIRIYHLILLTESNNVWEVRR